jgi:hypothetical protein
LRNRQRISFTDTETERSWLFTMASGELAELPGRVVGFVDGALVLARTDGDEATYSVSIDGRTHVVTTSATAEVETLADGTVIVVEPTGQVRLVKPDGSETEVAHVTITDDPNTDLDGYVSVFPRKPQQTVRDRDRHRDPSLRQRRAQPGNDRGPREAWRLLRSRPADG